MRPIVSFTSDFGCDDPYVATVKAVMLGICRELDIIDVTHAVAPQAIRQAVFLSGQAWPYFPEGTVHLAVVDPGVGTARRAIAVRTPTGFAVGPDNGVLSAALSLDSDVPFTATPSDVPITIAVPVPAGHEVRLISSPEVVRSNPSATFHGRDLFGPCAAALAAGFPFDELGPRCDEILIVRPFHSRTSGTGVHGVVIHVDRFGNLITSVRRSEIPERATSVRILDRSVPLVRTYGDGTGLIALVGSTGYLEVALVNGSAARELDAGIDTPFLVPRP
jgi:S-adenosylmethionine hydrolase